MRDKVSLFQILTELAVTHPKLVLMRRRNYYRVEDLLRWARRDREVGTPRDMKALTDPAYWHTQDTHGKILIKRIEGDRELVAYVEPGSDVQTDPE
jgi:hypothetical protein